MAVSTLMQLATVFILHITSVLAAPSSYNSAGKFLLDSVSLILATLAAKQPALSVYEVDACSEMSDLQL